MKLFLNYLLKLPWVLDGQYVNVMMYLSFFILLLHSN